MTLLKLTIDDLRCIEHAELELHPGHNLIWGGNGSGKTSLLEAIFLLGRGRSFRTRNSERLIRYGRERLVVFGRSVTLDTSGSAVWAPTSDVQGQSSPRTRLGAPEGSSAAATPLSSSAVESRSPVVGVAATVAGARGDAEVMRQETGRGPNPPNGDLGSAGVGAPSGEGHDRTTGASSQAVQSAMGLDAMSGAGPPLSLPLPPPPALLQALGLQVSRTEGTVARINGSTTKSLTELTQLFPVQVIDPGIHKLLEEGGHRRRRWLDWGVFHVEQQFGDWWVRYARIVKQRNAALRSHPEQAGVWDPELVRLGELIAEARGRFVDALLPYWRESVLALSGLEPELHYFKGWAQDVSLADALKSARTRDQTRGLTHPGPHRADILIRLNGRPAREVLSRGQQKLVAVAMTLAQLNLLQVATQTTPTLLLDDPAAELDGDHLRRFIEQVMRLRSQLVLTSLHPEAHLFGTPDRVFHVEQGRVEPGYKV